MNEHLHHKAQKIFSRFSPFIRHYIYSNGWNELRKVQIEAADLIFSSEHNVLISSETSSGKTEAAFFPILSMMEAEGAENFLVIYISPLKSLINDQYSRMDQLLQESNLPVFRWHGDVGQSHKQSFLKNPRGLLQITPESLESMLIRRSNDIPRLFGNLRFVIIDEIHALMGSDRGNQILCQLQRISRLISHQPRRIALSATIGKADDAAAWLSGGSDRETKVIQISAKDVTWKLGLEHFFTTQPSDTHGVDPASDFIYRITDKEKCVVFSNSREETEDITANLRRISQIRKESDRFYIHHGNLSAAIREDAEAVLKSDDEKITVCATVTLELGIDIGKLKRVVNQGAPATVSGFLQRIGRSGRRGEAPEMIMVFREEEALPNAPLFQVIPWELLQAIAIIQLYREERWIEPCGKKPFPASLIFHQTLSVLAGKGSLPAQKLAKEVLSLSPFHNVTKEDYREILLHMLKNEYLQLTDEKELIVGLKGEKLLSSFKFFAVFKDSEDFTVRSGSQEIGTISSTPPIGERFALAGRVWEVEEVDVARKLIYAKNVEGKMKISWPGDYGFIHTRILEKMQRILLENEVYPYLLPSAIKRLEEARALAKNTGIGRSPILALGRNSFLFLPWLGTKSFQTLKRILKSVIAPALSLYDIQSGGCYYITYKSEVSQPESVLKAIHQVLSDTNFNKETLVAAAEYPIYDKFDSYLPHTIVRKAYAENRLELDELQSKAKSGFPVSNEKNYLCHLIDLI